jgi:hypothetical protein
MTPLRRYKQRMAPLKTGPTVDHLRREKRATRAAVIKHTRILVWMRDAACRHTHVASPDDEMHEVISRAKLRGRPPMEIFNTWNCLRVSHETHRQLTEHTLAIEFTDAARGCNAPVIFRPPRKKDDIDSGTALDADVY